MIDLYNFAAWLDTADETRFKRKHGASCPIACYLKDQTGKEASVGVLSHTVNGGPSISNPYWAKKFVQSYDESGRSAKSIVKDLI